MQKRGPLKEYGDLEDKRSKRLELTEKGESDCTMALTKIESNAKMLLNDLTSDDMELCIQLLKHIEIKLSAQWQKHKGNGFEEIFAELMHPGD